MSEWAHALNVEADDPDAMTIAEIVDDSKLGRGAVTKRVMALVAAGQAVKTVKMVPGRGRVTAYRLLPPAKKAKRAA